jgi:DNA (cytosine-5)-methyltransferase 1
MMKVLSLFDGIAGAKQALQELNVDCEYYACEIDKYAIKIASTNHPDINYFGYWPASSYDVKDLLSKDWESYSTSLQHDVGYISQTKLINNIDLLIGGSPCQDLSGAGKGNGLEGKRSGLFFEYVRILETVKPKFFILENVASMKKENRDKISSILGIEPIMIDSALVTAQQRKRYYWVGKLLNGSYQSVLIKQPEDQKIYLKDILENGVTDRDKSFTIDANYWKGGNLKSYFEKHRRQLIFQPIATSERGRRLNKEGTKRDDKDGGIVRLYDLKQYFKSYNLTTVQKDNYITENYIIRNLTTTECEILQGFPDGYTEGVSNTQRYKALGNSFTVPVIKHILGQLKERGLV